MYRPSAISLGNTLADVPFSATRVLIFNLIVYFLSGMHRSAGAFFTFHLFVYIAFLTMQGFFRTFGLLCVNFDSAFRLAVFFVPNLSAFIHAFHMIFSDDFLVSSMRGTWFRSIAWRDGFSGSCVISPSVSVLRLKILCTVLHQSCGLWFVLAFPSCYGI